MAQLTAVSLFAGVGGFDLALERNGVKVVASVEIDKHASKVLAQHFPNSQLFNDVKEVTGEQLRAAGFTGEHGIITGGFPCQDLSVAGRREGLAGARSGLFWEICRLLDETKSRYFILENVPGLLSSQQGRDMGAVTAALSSRGYSVAWRTLDAQHFGVPQRRRRVFLVGCLGDHWRTPSEILALAEGRRGYLAASDAKRKDASRTSSSSSRSGGILGSEQVGTLAARDYKGVGNQYVNENKLVVDYPEQTVGTITTAFGAKNYSNHQEVMEGSVLAYRKSKRAQTNQDDETWVEDDVTNTINTFDLGDTRTTEVITSRPTLFEATRVDDSRFYEDYSPTVASYWGTGGARVPYVVRDDEPVVMRNREGKPGGGKGPMLGDKSFTLATANDQTIFASTVRRLTPVECERLQGFPDNWTAGQADSHRYKQMGNAVAVPVVEWIVKRLVAAHKAGA